MTVEETREFSHLVVVGSSAGGIEALSRVLSALPEDFPAPVVIAQHMHPERESHLEEILSSHSKVPVRTVTGQAPLESGVAFVVPADRHVEVTGTEIRLHEDGRGRPKPSIDLLMTSASEAYGESLIAVVLSGTGSDGTEGARAVKQAGGTVIVQDPETAEFPGMPRSIAPNTVDIVSDVDEIGPLLSELLSRTGIPDKTGEEDSITGFLEELRQRHGIDFGDYKRPTIWRRLQRRFAATGVDGIEDYRRYLEENPEEYRQLINTFLIKVTEFFRDPEQFEYLRDEVLPELIERSRQSGEQLRIWSAGCATGEEAYSLAILVSEALDESPGDGTASSDVRVFATDLDGGAVEHARRGVYTASALSGLSEEQVSRHFEASDGLYHVKQDIRGMLVFGEHDLAQRSPFPRLDLIVSRNVLIYFTPELQRRTLQLFAFSLKDEGYLMLGASESASQLSEYFALVDRGHIVFRRQGERFVMPATGLKDLVSLPPRTPAHGRHSLRPPEPPEPRRTASGEWQLEERVLDRLPVGVVAVDSRYDILSINSAARRLLSVHGPAVGEDLLHLVREAPYDELRAAIDACFQDAEPSSTGEFAVEEVTTGEYRDLRMVCHPHQEERERDLVPPEGAETGPVERVTIVVEDVTGSFRVRRELEERLRSTSAEFEEYRRRSEADYESLRREAGEESDRRREQNARLVEANRQLDAANRELTSTVEELRSANEHHQLSAEEAQAATEEVETLNEELQATVEELETVNEELQATVEELNTTNEDLQNRTSELREMSRAREQEQAQMHKQLQTQLQTILEGIPEAMLVVEPSGQAVLTNEAYRQAFPEDGVPRDDSGTGLPEEQTPQGRASRGESFTLKFTVEDREGMSRRYEARGNPVGDGRRRGGVIVFRELAGRTTEDG